MPIQRIERLTNGAGEEIGMRLHGAGSQAVAEVLYSDVPGNNWNPLRLARFTSLMQDQIDFRIPINDPSLSDDPAGSTDPGREDFFYEGGDLVSRAVIISDAVNENGNMNFRIRRADPNKPAP